MTSWRKHRFYSLPEQDGNDSLAAGTQFVVKRVGSTCVESPETTGSSVEEARAFYNGLLEIFHCEHGCKLRLVVDLSGALLFNKDGDLLQRFELSNIRDVIYSTTKQQHSRYFILVAQEESELTVKAHVLLCEDKHKAKLLYDTFIEVFTLGSEIRKCRRLISDNSALDGNVHQKIRLKSEPTNSGRENTRDTTGCVNTLDSHGKISRRQTWAHSSIGQPARERPEHQNDSFTQLARSRHSSSTSLKLDASDMNANKIVSDDFDVFM